MARLTAFVTVVVLFIGPVSAQEPIRFGRTPDISNDGKLVAFSYLGDIWVVETIGGIARPVTMHEAHEINPVFSPDGKSIAFSSNRNGAYNVYVVPVHGGKPRRLTYDSAPDMVCGWSPDGKNILFATTRGTQFPPAVELWSVPAAGGRETRVSLGEGKEGVYSPSGDQIAYVRGPGTWYRKGYRGSSNDDIWICDADGWNNRRLTTFNGQDASPMWSPDGQTIYYVSEHYGTPANIVRIDAAGKTKPQLITFHKDEAVRKARISGNGEWIVYECGCDLYVVSTREGSSPRKLAIEVHADDKANTERTITFTRGVSEFAPSWDEKHVAFVVHGEIFLIPRTGGKATRLTHSPAFDHDIAWSPDSKKIIFASDRGGHEDLYLLEPDDPEHPELVTAHRFKATQLTNSPDDKVGVSFSPDGKLVAFLRAGRLCTMKPDGSDLKEVVKEVHVFDYDWSPDSKYFVYARRDGSFASELYIVPVTGGESRNITRYATFNAGVTWSGNGKKIAFLSHRRGQVSMYCIALQKPAAPGVPESQDIDWDDIHLRVEQPAPIPVDQGAINKDGTQVAFRSISSNGDDLWIAQTNGSNLRRLSTGNIRPQQIMWSRVSRDVIWFRDGQGQIRLASQTIPGDPAVVPFSAKMTIRRDEEFAEMFDQSWRALREKFYDNKFHGIDWYVVRDRYRPVVKHVSQKEDLYALISLMMGELNASHLGISGFLSTPDETTADLGLIFDDAYKGRGLKIAEIVKRGPADRRGIALKPGDVIGFIDRTELTEQTNISQLLNDKVGEMVTLKVTSDPSADPRDPKAWRRVEIQAASRAVISNLMYERWVEKNTARVADLSKGRLGYIHIPSMDEAGLDRFVRSLYSDNFDKDAIVLDVRYNSGGFTHDQVLNYLGGKEHTIFRQRDGGEGFVLRSHDRKWTKPLVLLINNRSYSDAEIFPSAFRTLKLGKLVGQPTGGFVIGTTSIQLIDGSTFRIPRTGVFTPSGVNMEREGVAPDVFVDIHPDQLAKGMDPQLEKAVEVLLEDVAAWKRSNPKIVLQPSPSDPPDEAPMKTPAPEGK
jgi:tricorn protease